MDMQAEEVRIKKAREALLEQCAQYERRLKNPVNRQTGKPLDRKAIKIFTNQVTRLKRLVAMHDRHIKRLTTDL
jgi:hypothetical protein